MSALLPYPGASTIVDAVSGDIIAECPDPETARWLADVVANAVRATEARNEFSFDRAMRLLREAVARRPEGGR